MKRYIISTFAVLLVALMPTGCKKDKTTDEVVTTPIEVTYSLGGEQVRALPFNSASRSVRVDVALNNQNIYWTVVSDAEWCSVVEEEHCGNGGFTLNIKANEEFEDRVPARLTFVAGQFRGFEMEVSQSGNVFLLNQVYAVGSKETGSADFEVSVQEGVEWSIADNEWLTATKGDATTANGMVTTKITVAWSANADAARYGAIGFVRSGLSEADANFNVFQFGNEVVWNEAGAMAFAAENAAPFTLKAPAHTIAGIVCPESVTYESVENEDNTVSYTFTLADNPSDTRSSRETHIAFKIIDREGEVALPAISQDYYPVSGITSAEGLALFARTFNAGGDIADWQKEGKVVLLNNIDMSQLVSAWEPVGTADVPFAGEFDGQYRKIMGFASSQPLFGVCKGATLRNLIVDESSAFVSPDEYNIEYTLAPLAAHLTDCTVSECSNYAPVTMNATTGNNATKAYVAGLVGISEGTTTLTGCVNYGAVEATAKAQTAKGQGVMYVGGVAAINNATMENCSNEGAVSDAAMAESHYIGGIAGFNGGTVHSATNKGVITTASMRAVKSDTDDSRNIYLGGIAGMNEGAITSSTNSAGIVSASDVKLQRIGGIAGRVNKIVELSANTNTEQGALNINGTSTTFRGVRQLMLGGLYGEIACDARFDFAATPSGSAGAITVASFEESDKNSFIYIGGLFGHIERDAVLTVISPEWNSAIKVDATKANRAAIVFAVGGIVGGVGIVATSSTPEYGGHLTVADAKVKGEIEIAAKSSVALKLRTAGIGGVAGMVCAGGATLTGCTNDATIQQSVTNARNNAYAQHMGGIIGFIAGGDSEIRGCTNNGVLDNEHYNNNNWTNGGTSGSIGGIIGAYGYKMTIAGTIKIADCVNTATVRSKRGMSGGIAGYLREGEIKGCNNSGSMAQGERSFIGGIAAVVENTAVSGCTALCNIGGMSAGSETYNGGGVVGILGTGSSVADCAYFGDIVCNSDKTNNAGEAQAAGLIVANPYEGTTVSGCKAGGKIPVPVLSTGTSTVVTADNVANFIVGNANVTPTGCTYWDGK